MKCPICGQQLRPGKKDPNYLLCYNCKKKFKAPQQKQEREEEQRYSNIPPKKVREKRETEMRKAYDDLLSIEDEKRKPASKTKRRQEPEYDYDDGYDEYDDVYDDDEPISKAPIIILAIAIIVVAAVIGYMLLK